MIDDAEKLLFQKLHEKELSTASMFDAGDYTSGLAELTELKDSVDRFFDDVLIMCDDESLQNNRIALLQRLRDIFLKVADISFLRTS